MPDSVIKHNKCDTYFKISIVWTFFIIFSSQRHLTHCQSLCHFSLFFLIYLLGLLQFLNQTYWSRLGPLNYLATSAGCTLPLAHSVLKVMKWKRMFCRYEKLPLDFRTPFIFNMENFPQPSNTAVPLSMAANRTASSTLASLSRYFLHQRWVWAMQSSQGLTVAMQAVAHILSMLSEWVHNLCAHIQVLLNSKEC